jgi:hypothetical protein
MTAKKNEKILQLLLENLRGLRLFAVGLIFLQ